MSWTAIKDELPPERVPVHVCWEGGSAVSNGVMVKCMMRNNRGRPQWRGYGKYNVFSTPPTHWMAWPEYVDKEG